jgi:peroxiredoxin
VRAAPRLAALIASVAVLVPLTAAPASAHAADAVTATDYRSVITSVRPAVAGLSIREIETGSRLQVVNHTGRDVTVLGYAGEPYLRIGAGGGVWENTRSVATYTNRTIAGTNPIPASADNKGVAWRRVGGGDRVRWHDHRTHWMIPQKPPLVAADPGHAHAIGLPWQVQLVAGSTPVTVTGTLTYLPPPTWQAWWALVLLAAAAVALLGGRLRLRWAAPAALTSAVALSVVDSVGQVIDFGYAGPGILGGLLAHHPYPVLTWAGAIGALVLYLRGSSIAPFTVGLAGACVAVLAGLPRVGVFHHAVGPVPWSTTWSRWCVAGAVGLAAGAVLAEWWRSRRPPGKRPVRPARVDTVTPMTDSTDGAVRLQPGDAAPDFDLAGDTGDRVKLSDYKGQRVILYVYPAAMTPGCTKQACDFRDSLDALHAAGYQVIGLSPDKPEKLAKFRAAEGLTFPLASDPDKQTLTAYGAYGEKKLYGKTTVGVIRSTFVINPDGTIAEAQYNVKATGHVAKLRRDLNL